MNDKKKNVAVITGASLGIGADVANRFLERGVDVINIANVEPKYQHPGLTTVITDLTDRAATKALAQQLGDEYDVGYFVHCAGAVKPALMEDVNLEDMDYLQELHINSALILAQHFVPSMKGLGFGRIILISTRGILGLVTRTGYASTKSAMLGLVRTWALEFASHGITINAVAPGPIETEMFRDQISDAARRQEIANTVPVGRLGTPADIGRVIDFLGEEQSSFITGQTFYICGGASLGVLTM